MRIPALLLFLAAFAATPQVVQRGSVTARGLVTAKAPAQWYVDPVSGSDINAGTSAALPVRTFDAVSGKGSYVAGNPIEILENSVWSQASPVAAGLVDYYRAGSTSAADGALIGTWLDSSGQGNTALQATGAQQPHINLQTTFGVRSVAMKGPASGVNMVLPNTLVLNSRSLSFFVIAEQTGSDEVDGLAYLGAGANFQMLLNRASSAWGRIGVYDGSEHSATAQPAIAFGPNMYGVTSDGTAIKVWTQTTDSSLTLAVSNTLTGGTLSSASPLSANVYEVLIFNRAISSTEAGRLLTYAQQRYGVYSGAVAKQAAMVGDSLTSNFVISATGKGWVQQAQIKLPGIQVMDFAVQGSQSNAMYSPDWMYNAALAKNICVVWSGTNDLAASVATATVLTRIQTYVAARRATGWQVVTATLLPRNTGGTFEADRQTVNTALRANAGSIYGDAIADIGNDPTIGQAGQYTNTTYYAADGIHLIDAGNTIAANTYFLPALAGLGIP